MKWFTWDKWNWSFVTINTRHSERAPATTPPHQFYTTVFLQNAPAHFLHCIAGAATLQTWATSCSCLKVWHQLIVSYTFFVYINIFYSFRYSIFRSLFDKNRVSILSPAASKFLRNEQSKHMLGYVMCVVWLWCWFLEGYLLSKWMRLHAVFKTITNYQHKGITQEQNKGGGGTRMLKMGECFIVCAVEILWKIEWQMANK